MKSESQVASRGRQIGVTRLNGRPDSVGANKSPESGKLSKDLPGKSSKRSERNRILFPMYRRARALKVERGRQRKR